MIDYRHISAIEPGDKLWDDEGKFPLTVLSVEFIQDGTSDDNEEHYRVEVENGEVLRLYPDQEVAIFIEDENG